jgi:RNA polymerase sigma-70 factor (ECF subfamily)
VSLHTASTHFDPSAARSWQKLTRHFELDQGFALIFVLVPDAHFASVCRLELCDWLKERGKGTIQSIVLPNPSELETLPEVLLAIEPRPDAAAFWCEAVFPRSEVRGSPYYEWRRAWERAAIKFNRIRDSIVSRLPQPLLLVGAPWMREVVRDAAPDFWSIRSFVAEFWPPMEREPSLDEDRKVGTTKRSSSGDDTSLEGEQELKWIKTALDPDLPVESREVAFSKLVSTYSGRILSIFRIFGLRDWDARDELQDLWLWLWLHGGKNRDFEQPVWPWIRALARNRVFERLRTLRRRSILEVDEDLGRSAYQPSAQESVTLLRELLEDIDRLPRPDRDVIQLTIEGLSSSEIAERLGLPTGTVEKRRAHAARLLRGILDGVRK